MPAQVIPMVRICDGECKGEWKSHFLDFMDTRLDVMEDGCHMNSLGDITAAIMANRSDILGELAWASCASVLDIYWSRSTATVPSAASN